ncbi:MAG TPA: PAS domain-containing sensor histidine kinase, partial [Gammaproteobacteria bacterium]|nr:PAS domain-containing sensor histidine kinase [Gammaproteobacteria bacterium]
MVNHKAIGNLKILEDLAKIASIIPAPIYWEDVDSVILGANEYVLEATGLKALNDYVGKTLYELYPKEMADHIKQHNEEVMRTGKVLSQEETITDTTGQIKHYAAVKAPLRDDTGTIIGVVGTSIEITAQKEIERVKREQEVERLRLEKEAEHLKMESEVHKKLTQEQEKFIKLANQVAHDIRSPLASLLMIVKSCTEIPETDRIALREAAISIGDIANHLLNQYQKKDTDSPSETEVRQPILISAVLLQLLTDKKYQYQNLPIKFDHNFIQSAYFAFINIEPSAFKRMISNLINNAVDSFDGNKGKVELKLEATNEWVNVSINDNGKGMAAELMNKILSNVAVTAGKKTGYGIGLTQVREA